MIGRTLDRYRIESKLGEGGMGVVYKAHDTHLGRVVAVKVLPHDRVADPDRRQRFVQEARAASSLDHPNIVAVHDIRSDSGVDFIVMEYVEGRTLDQVIPAKGLGVVPALRYAVQVADALARAHEAGVVHRDLKPSNLIVTDEGRVKIVDFGLAKLVDPGEGTGDDTQTAPLTRAGMVIGTTGYMSPEQAEGRKVDARSDVFSFGAVLYEMVTGRRAFSGDSHVAVYLLAQWQRSSAQRAAPLRAVPLTALPGVVRSPTFSPDGNHVAFTWNGPRQDNSDVYVLQIGAGAPLRLTTDAATDYSPAWSPDGRAIAFLRERPDPEPHELRLVPPLGGPERKVAGIRPRGFLRPVTMAWCPDSSCLLVTDSEDHTRPDALVVVSVESGDKRPLTTPQHPIFADTDPAVSPDGGWLAFRRDAAPYSGQLQVARLGDGPRLIGEPRSITPAILGAYGPDWISNREIAFWAKGALWRTGTSEGSVPERLPFGEDGITVAVSRSQPGRPARLAYVRSYADTNIWEVRTSGEEGAVASPPVVAISSTRREGTPQLAPDGRQVAFISDRSGEMEIWVAARSGGNPVQLTSMGAVPGFPRWSPDGETIAFHANPEGQGDIFVVPASGGRVRQVTSGPENEAFASFSRDGRWIYFSTSRGGTPSICKTPVSGGHVVQVSAAGALLAIESPDGANLYYVTGTAPGDAGRLWRLPLRGGEPVSLVDGVLATGFDVLDEGVYYLEPLSGETRLRHLDFATGRATTVADRLGRVVFGLTASRDGQSVLYSRVDTSIEDLMLVEGFR